MAGYSLCRNDVPLGEGSLQAAAATALSPVGCLTGYDPKIRRDAGGLAHATEATDGQMLLQVFGARPGPARHRSPGSCRPIMESLAMERIEEIRLYARVQTMALVLAKLLAEHQKNNGPGLPSSLARLSTYIADRLIPGQFRDDPHEANLAAQEFRQSMEWLVELAQELADKSGRMPDVREP